MRFIGRRDRRRAGAARADGLGGGDDRRATSGSRCSWPSTTAAGRRSSTRRATFDGRRREEEFRAHLYAPEMHDPDLIIRTSGEQRLSNYLLWQSAYSELDFTDELWPDFSRADLEDALAEFDARAPPLRRALMATRLRAPRGPHRAAAAQASDLGARVWSRSRRSRLAIVSSSPGRLGLRGRASSLLGLVCLHELFRLYEPRPPGPAGRLPRRSIGLAAAAQLRRRAPGAARHGGARSRCRSCSGWRCRSDRTPPLTRGHGDHAARRALDRSRARARGAAARARRTATAIVVDVLVGTFIGDTAAYLGGRAFGTRRLAPRDLAQQDRRGADVRRARRHRSPSGAPASTRTGCRAGRRSCSAPWSAWWRRSATCSSRRSSATPARRTPGRCSAPHGGALDRLDAALFTLVAGYYVWLALS